MVSFKFEWNHFFVFKLIVTRIMFKDKVPTSIPKLIIRSKASKTVIGSTPFLWDTTEPRIVAYMYLSLYYNTIYGNPPLSKKNFVKLRIMNIMEKNGENKQKSVVSGGLWPKHRFVFFCS